METSRTATEELILSTPHKHPPTPANPGVRPSYRDVQINKLARQMYSSYWQVSLPLVPSVIPERWFWTAEAAVDELIDRPEREFQQQLAAVVARNEEADSMGSWAPATASGWL